MGNLTILIAASLVSVVLVYFFFKLGESKTEEGKDSHVLLQILILALFMGSLLIVGKVALDDRNFCSWNVVNTTVSGSTTSFGYEYQCSENPNQSSVILYNILRWFVYLASAYIFVYVLWKIYMSFVKPLLKNGLRLK